MGINNLTPEQERAVFTHDRPIFVSAGAGSGKTAVLVRRYLALLARGLKPRQILAVTFTNEAANELRQRIYREIENKKLGEEIENSPYIGTIHSFCYHLLASYGSAIQLPRIASILSPFQFSETFEKAYQEWLRNTPSLEYLLSHYTPAELRELAQSAYTKRHQLNGELAPEFQQLLALLKPLFENLQANFHSNGLFTFDDLEYLALRILQEVPLARIKIQSELEALLIDEFQDTSQIQWNIIEQCLGDNPTKLYLVGDPKQSIYSFRNADVSLFKTVQTLFADGLSLELKHNFRTSFSLLSTINELSQPLFRDSPVPFTAMEPARENTEQTRFEILTFASSDDLSRMEIQDREVETIANSVAEKCARSIPPQDIALLFRNSDRMPVYEQALLARSLPVYCQRRVNLFKSYSVVDLISFLKAVLDPLDDLNLAALLIQTGYTFDELWKLRKATPETPLLVPLLENPPPSLRWFIDLLDSGETRVAHLLPAYFSALKPHTDRALLAFCEPLSEEGLTLTKLSEKLSAWRYQNLSIDIESGDRSKGIRLMTVHAAKGLEFPHVVLVDSLRQPPRHLPLLLARPGMGAGIKYRDGDEWVECPHYTRLKEVQSALEKEESNRILYVAFTRARDTLTFVLPDCGKLPAGSWSETLSQLSKHL